MAEWFAINMPDIDFQDIYYYLRPSGEQVDDWDDLPEQMKVRRAKRDRMLAEGVPAASAVEVEPLQQLLGVAATFGGRGLLPRQHGHDSTPRSTAWRAAA